MDSNWITKERTANIIHPKMKIHVMLDGLRGQGSLAGLGRRAGYFSGHLFQIAQGLHGGWEATPCGRIRHVLPVSMRLKTYAAKPVI
ncbi:MAG: hypothetical protein ACI9IV_001987 [Paracoccaceae bacterium]